MQETEMENVSKFPDREAIKQEAGRWLARLDRGNLSRNEREELRLWIAKSKFHQEYLKKLATNWDSMEILSELAELFPLKPEDQEFDRPKGRRATWAGASAVAVTLLLILVFIVDIDTRRVPSTSPAPETYHTAIGEQASFLLQDGTTIKLNTNSRISVNLDANNRAVTLQRGEASFQVSPDPARPFVVLVGSGMIWAVGTEFNVRLKSGTIDVTVTEGIVKVFANVNQLDDLDLKLLANPETPGGEEEVILQAGQSVQYGQSIKQPEAEVEKSLDQKLAWREGALIFQGESLCDAVAEISRYTDLRIVIVDPSINDIPIGGHFKSNDIGALIASLDSNFNIRSERVSQNQINLSAK